jgi:hypothetical protein
MIQRRDTPPAVGVVAHRVPELRRKDDIVAAALERLAHDLLGLPGGVHVGGIHEVDARVERGVDDPSRVVVVGVAPGANIIVPRQSFETWTPVRPSGRYSMTALFSR